MITYSKIYYYYNPEGVLLEIKYLGIFHSIFPLSGYSQVHSARRHERASPVLYHALVYFVINVFATLVSMLFLST